MENLIPVIKNMWAISLNQEIPHIPEGDFSSFFIVNHIDDESFIHSLASTLILAGCTEFHFFGAHENVWHFNTDIADIDLGGLNNDSIFTPTNGYDTEAEFRQELVHHYVDLNDDDHRYYLFSDDDRLLNSACRYIKEMELWETILLEKVSFVEKILSDFGAVAVGEIEFNSHRYDMDGAELYSVTDADAHVIWQLNNSYIVIDTILFPETPCLILERSDKFEGPYEDVDPIPYNLSDDELIHEIQTEIFGNFDID